MGEATATAILSRAVPTRRKSGAPCLVHIYPPGSALGSRHALGDQPVIVGRSEDSHIRIRHKAVSRNHARIERVGEGHEVTDLGSTNGVFINDAPVKTARLKDGDYLRIGHCIYRFLSGNNVEVAYHEEIHRLIILDPLTGTHNRRSLNEFLDRELARSARHARPLALILFDIDFFKTINDQFGHLAGDHALKTLASCIKGMVRKEDLMARYGGEEFALVVVECDRAAALDMAERLRQRVEKETYRFEGNTFKMTVSAGVSYTTGEPAVAVSDLVRLADENLYRAKAAGRNQVVG